MHYLFPDLLSLGEPFQYIHPHKQRIVHQIQQNLPDWVELCIVFGSSIDLSCKEISDIDLAIIGKRETPIDTLGHETDILLYDSLEE